MTPGFQEFWRIRESWFSREFSDFVAERIASSEKLRTTLYEKA